MMRMRLGVVMMQWRDGGQIGSTATREHTQDRSTHEWRGEAAGIAEGAHHEGADDHSSVGESTEPAHGDAMKLGRYPIADDRRRKTGDEPGPCAKHEAPDR